MRRLAQQRQDVVGGEAPAIVAHVNDEAILARTHGVQLAFELLEAGPVHPTNVDVAQATVGEGLDLRAVVTQPLLVEEPAGPSIGNRA